MLFKPPVTPHVFQPVELSILRKKNVYNNVYVVNQHPLQGLPALMPIWQFATFLLYFRLHKIRDRLYLHVRAGFTYNKEIGYRFMDLAQIERDYIFTLFFLDCFDNAFKKLAVPRQSCHPLWPGN